MHSSLIGKVQKAKQYAQEPDRITFTQMKLNFRGDNGDHVVSLVDGHWHCTCNFFAGWGLCSHTMAMERILGDMVPVKSTLYDQSTQKPAAAAV